MREVAEPCRPVVIRGLVRSWPAVSAAERSPHDFRNYVLQFDVGGAAEVFIGDPQIAGRYYYSDDLKRFNFERRHMKLADALEAITACAPQSSMYLGSLPIDALRQLLRGG